MRPVELRVKGFTSFRDEQTVDFRDLDLFVITGPTGAGKTSLLDAMTFALYGSVPRMGKQGLSELVTHGQAEARVLLQFSVDGEEYRVARRLPRKAAQSATFERLDGEEWVNIVDGGGVRAVNSAVGDLVKLDFESFCKAVMLPQGEFAAFLKGDPGERRETLVRLLGLSYFERMQRIAGGRARELTAAANRIDELLGDELADATEEAVAAATKALEEAKASAEGLEQALVQAQGLDARRTAARAAAELFEKLGREADELAVALEGEVDRCREAQSELTAAEKRQKERLKVAEASRLNAEQAKSQRDSVVERVGTAVVLAATANAAAKFPEQRKRAADAAAELATAEEEKSVLERAAIAAGDELSAAKDAVKTKREEAVAAQSRAREAQERQRGLTERLHAANSHEAACAALATEVKTARDELSAAETGVASARSNLADTKRELSRLEKMHVVAGLVAGLAAGDPCPVCAKPLEEHPDVPEDVKERLEGAEAAVKAADALVDQRRREHAGAETRLKSVSDRLADTERQREEAIGDQKTIAALESAAKAAAAELLEKEATATAADDASNVAQERLQAAGSAEAKARTELEANRSRAALLERARVAAEADRDATRKVLADRFGGDIPDDAATRIDKDRLELEAAEHAFEEARTAAGNDADALRDATEEFQGADKRLGEIDVALGRLRERAEGLLRDISEADGPGIDALPTEAELRDVRAAALAAWSRAGAAHLSGAVKTHRSTESETAAELIELGHVNGFDVERVELVVSTMASAHEAASHDVVRRGGDQQTAVTELERRRSLETSVRDDREKIAVLETLASELRGDKFVQFVVNESLELLAVRASEELLRVSDGRYSLVVGGAGFDVVDHANADERRSVKTLSGGETFMASLALALALSKHVTELAGEGLGARLEAVFIDEGFGSLDYDTLQEVIDALQRVREDDVIVGVISHVSELAERIQAGLEVRKNGNRSEVVPAVGS